MPSGLDVRPYGEAGLLVGVLGDDYEARWSRTQGLAAAIRSEPPPWLVDLVATYDHLFVTFDPALTDHPTVTDFLGELQITGGLAGGRVFEVPVLFGGEEGPDLVDVALSLGTSPDVLVERVCASPWLVRFVAGPVGAPFTERGDWQEAIPRSAVPRVVVPPGSLSVSGRQSLIYPVRSPGGWRLIGRTPVRLVSLEPADDLVPYRAGDLLHYVPIDRTTYDDLVGSDVRLGDSW